MVACHHLPRTSLATITDKETEFLSTKRRESFFFLDRAFEFHPCISWSMLCVLLPLNCPNSLYFKMKVVLTIFKNEGSTYYMKPCMSRVAPSIKLDRDFAILDVRRVWIWINGAFSLQVPLPLKKEAWGRCLVPCGHARGWSKRRARRGHDRCPRRSV